MKLGEAMYKAAQAKRSPRPTARRTRPSEDDVVDADFEEIDDDDDKKKSA